MALVQQSKWGSIIAGLGLLFICVATLTPGVPASPNATMDVCRRWCDDSVGADFVRNIVMFAPLAFGLRLGGLGTWRTLITGSCFSALIELLQIRVIVGRDASVLDWISNSLGTGLGILLASHLKLLAFPNPTNARRLAVGWFVCWVAILVLGAWGVQPAPGLLPYWGQRAPDLGKAAVFRGDLLSARVNGAELYSQRMPNDAYIREPLARGHARVEVSIRPTARVATPDIEPIARVADGGYREILMLGRGGDELVFRYRMHATALRLETPAFALENAFPSDTTLDTQLAATLDRGEVTLMSRWTGASRARSVEFSAGMAWSFFLPWDYWFGPNAVALSLLWLGGLLAPLGYWAARGDRRLLSLLVVWATSAASLAAVEASFALPPAATQHFAAILVGSGVGWLAALLSVHRREEPDLSMAAAAQRSSSATRRLYTESHCDSPCEHRSDFRR